MFHAGEEPAVRWVLAFAPRWRAVLPRCAAGVSVASIAARVCAITRGRTGVDEHELLCPVCAEGNDMRDRRAAVVWRVRGCQRREAIERDWVAVHKIRIVTPRRHCECEEIVDRIPRVGGAPFSVG